MRKLINISIGVLMAGGASAQAFNSGVNTNIPDCGTEVCGVINVTGVGIINAAYGLESVTIKINHTWDSDLDIFLEAPDGTRVELSTDNGGSGSNYGSGTANNAGPYTVFIMTAATAVTAGAAPFTASYLPEGDLGDVNNGQNANGNWQLCVTDDACGDVGFINAWSILFSATPAPPPAPCVGYIMGGGNQNTCSGNFYDTGCNTGNYGNSENITETYCSTAGNCISFNFSSFSTEACCDDLTIYDGPNVASPLIGTFAGTTLNGQTIQSSTGCLTFVWSSDGSITDIGWTAAISCSACPTCTDGIQNGSETGIDCGGSMCAPCPCSAGIGTGVTNVASLPYSSGAGTTCGSGNNLTSANTDACGSTSYLGGEDHIWIFTPTATGTIDINLTSSGSWTGLMLYEGCPLSGYGATCVDNSQSSAGDESMSCVQVTAGFTYYLVLDAFPAPTCNAYSDLTISAVNTGSVPTCNLSYSTSSIGYAPANYNTGTSITFLDDRFSPTIIPIGFSFCYDGVFYTELYISSNSYLTFPCSNIPGGDAEPDGYSPWSINAAAPNTTDAPMNSIMGPWQDIDPAAGGNVRYQTTGTAPNRRFIAKYQNVAMFDCTTMSFNGQIILNEIDHSIEVHLGNKPICTTWNGGAAILGLHNYNGTVAVVPAGRNYPTQWSATNEAWSFTPSCATCSIILPLGLLSFTGENVDDVNVLEWETSSESTVVEYEVQRSADTEYYTTLGTMEATADRSGVGKYSMTDHNAPEGVTYYRLKQVDANGDVEFTNPVAIRKKTPGAFDFTLVPNPADEQLQLLPVGQFNGVVNVTIYNTMGAVVQTESALASPSQVNISSLSKGLYFIDIEANGEVLRKKLLKK